MNDVREPPSCEGFRTCIAQQTSVFPGRRFFELGSARKILARRRFADIKLIAGAAQTQRCITFQVGELRSRTPGSFREAPP